MKWEWVMIHQMDGLMARPRMDKEHHLESDISIVKEGVLVWTAFIKPPNVLSVYEGYFLQAVVQKKIRAFKKGMVFMQDNAPSKNSTTCLASKGFNNDKIITWPPSLPDLNPIKSLWTLLKCELYREGRQYISTNSIWKAVVAAAQKNWSSTDQESDRLWGKKRLMAAIKEGWLYWILNIFEMLKVLICSCGVVYLLYLIYKLQINKMEIKVFYLVNSAHQ